MTFLLLLVSLAAALRLTRLAIKDTITQGLRNRIIALASRDGTKGRIGLWFAEMFECPWCVGFWASAAIAALVLVHWTLPVYALALSELVGLLYVRVEAWNR